MFLRKYIARVKKEKAEQANLLRIMHEGNERLKEYCLDQRYKRLQNLLDTKK